MKLLFLAHRIPYPPNKGDKIRSFHQLRALVERGHEIHLLAFADDASDMGYQVDLAKLCASVQIVPLNRLWAQLRALRTLLSPRPLSLGFYESKQMRAITQQKFAEEQFDAVFVYSSTMAQYVPLELASRTVVDMVDVDSEKWLDYARSVNITKSWLYKLEWQRLHRYEQEIVATFGYTLLTTAREAALLNQVDEFTRRARLRTLTNGVDLAHYRPEPWRLRILDKLPLSERQWFADPVAPRLVFTGAMDYYANIEGVKYFAESILPLVREREPHAEFLIVGSKPTDEVKQLGRLPGVQVTGFVEDVRPYLQAATICVVPLRIARGVQNKVLEAMAMGKASVSTPEGVAGLNVTDGEHLLMADSPRKFAEQIIKLIRNEKLRRELGENARSFVEEHHDWAPLLQRFVELLETLALRNGKGKLSPEELLNQGGLGRRR